MNLHIAPIVASLKRSKLGAGLLVLQIALTLAIVCNVLFIVGSRGVAMSRPTGLDEAHVFALGYRLDNPEKARGVRDADLAALRSISGVTDAVATNCYPLRGTCWTEGVSRRPGAKDIQSQDGNVSVYAFDQHGVGTFGLRLIAGRNFGENDLVEGSYNLGPLPGVAMITQTLARRLFREGAALGQSIYLSSYPGQPLRIVGVVERLQAPGAASTIDESAAEDSVVLPMIDRGPRGLYLVRMHAGDMNRVMSMSRDALLAVNPQRTLGRIKPLADVREAAYENDRSMFIALTTVCVVLVLVTALGIVGLTSFWVGRRRRQIGIRRALGATRASIVRYFLTENALLCIAGVIVGAALAEALNAWLGHAYNVGALPVWEVLCSAVLVLVLGQLAASVPSWRASRVEPVQALRSV